MTARVRRWAWMLAVLASTTLGTASPAAPAEPVSLPILVYHQIRDDPSGPPDSLEAIALSRFESQMRYLRDQGYVTLSAQEVVDFVRGGTAPSSRIIAIHFDDGWKSAQLALPILDRYAVKATFWIIAGTGIGWPHMDWEEIRAISRNPRYDIESHTMTHPWKNGDTLIDWMAGRVPGKGAEQARWELAESRRVLAENLGRPVRHLAWPSGLYDESLIRLAREAGYVGLFTVDNGVNRQGDSVLGLRRTMVHGGCDDQVFEQILRDGVYRACESAARAAGPAARSGTSDGDQR